MRSRVRGLVVVVGALVFGGCSRPEAAPEAARSIEVPRERPVVARSPAAFAERPQEDRRMAATRRLAMAEELLCSYHDASRYPFTSRPIAEHPDQVRPNLPISERRAMRGPNGARSPNIRIHTTQTRVFMAAGETVEFRIAATDEDGAPLALRVERAVARGLAGAADGAAPERVLALTDDGQGGDAVAGDGTTSGALAPAETEFAGFAGTIRTEITYRVAGQAGVAWLDVLYSPEVPATWSGPIREVVEDGGLAFYLPVRVEVPGRYLVAARVDDARGEPQALLSFNDVLGAGEREIRLALHGKLIRDLAPTFPLRLRDIDAFLLREDTDPDRALMPRLAGEAHVTRIHALSGFSAAEWQSEERSRYLTEFFRDVEAARGELAELDPGQPGLAFTMDQCRGFNASRGVPQS